MRSLLDSNVTVDTSMVEEEEVQLVEAFTLLFKHGLDIHKNLSLRRVPLMYVLSHLSIVYLAMPDTIARDRHVSIREMTKPFSAGSWP